MKCEMRLMDAAMEMACIFHCSWLVGAWVHAGAIRECTFAGTAHPRTGDFSLVRKTAAAPVPSTAGSRCLWALAVAVYTDPARVLPLVREFQSAHHTPPEGPPWRLGLQSNGSLAEGLATGLGAARCSGALESVEICIEGRARFGCAHVRAVFACANACA